MSKKSVVALLCILPLTFNTVYQNNKQILSGSIQTKQNNASMEKCVGDSNLLIKQLEAKEKEYKEQQRKIAEQKRLKEIEEQKKRANVPSYVLNRGGSYRKVRLRVSYYTISNECCGNTLGITKSGKKIQDGMIACPKGIEFGTQIYFDNKIYTCEDRGSAINVNNGVIDIDVYVKNATHKQLMDLGVKYVDGWILE